ncbi:tRNA methyltransferase [Bacillus coahuilensis p1.1.43]|uniref:tRNA methyltransferase n=1 Tax=Bacillus coahuilensis p1.1.43 TaxID=1150625 RepID=A0A147K7I4_9BACI|nr:DUF2624 domain-containing protein [Bacillus coahuilensis]KUP06005.1 tRNA methyltransferase [Bacillus coahuilensis p1.1.43]
MNLIKSVINNKINNITADELMKYAQQYSISLTNNEAVNIAGVLKGKKYDVFNDSERSVIIREISKIAGVKTAKEVNRLFLNLTRFG